MDNLEHLKLSLNIYAQTVVLLLKLAALSCVSRGVIVAHQRWIGLTLFEMKKPVLIVLAILASIHCALLIWKLLQDLFRHDSDLATETHAHLVISLITRATAISLAVFWIGCVIVIGALAVGWLHDTLSNEHDGWTIRWVAETAVSEALIYVGMLSAGYIVLLLTLISVVVFVGFYVIGHQNEDDYWR